MEDIIPGTSKILVIDFRDTSYRDSRRDLIMDLFEKGMYIKEITKELGSSARLIFELIKEECCFSSDEKPDFRKCSGRKQAKQPNFPFGLFCPSNCRQWSDSQE